MLIRVLTWTSLAMSVVSFLVFVVLSFRLERGSNASAAEAAQARRGVDITDLTKLAEAGARLADSFTKAGPVLSALVASILYLLIGTLGAGLDRLSQR
jgi:hypothetical protein